MPDERDKRRDYHTPPFGVPTSVAADDELSVPVLVDSPTLSRTKTDSSPPYMTAQQFARVETLKRKQLERDLAVYERDLRLVLKKLDEMGQRIIELGQDGTGYNIHIETIQAAMGEFKTLAEFREDIYRRVTDLSGKDGTNGKVGTLRKELDKSSAWTKTLIMFALGLVVSAGTVVFWAGSTVAELQANVTHLQHEVDRLRAGTPYPSYASEPLP